MSISVLVIGDYRGKQLHTMRPEAEILIDLVREGFKMSLMTESTSLYAQRFRDMGVHVIPFFPTAKFKRSEIRFIRKQLIDGQYDILYLVHNNNAISAGIQAARRLAVKVVLYRGAAANLHWLMPFSYIKHLHPRVDKIICNSKGVEDYFHRQRFFDKSKTAVIVKGHSLEWYRDIRPAELTQYGLRGNEFVVIWAGTNRQRIKGLKYLMQASYYWPEHANIHLLLIGKNIECQENVRLANNSPNGP